MLALTVVGLCGLLGGSVGAPSGSLVDGETVGFEEFLKDIAMAAESPRVRRQPVEEIVERAVLDVLSGRPDGEQPELRRMSRNNAEDPVLVMGSPFPRQDCGGERSGQEGAYPWQYYQHQDQQYQQYQPGDGGRTVGLASTPLSGGGALQGAIGGLSALAGLGGQGAANPGGLGHSGLSLPGLGALGHSGLNLAGGLGGLHGGGAALHSTGASLAQPLAHESPVYYTTIPYISGYSMSPIVSEKQVIVKDSPLHGLVHHKSASPDQPPLEHSPQDFFIQHPGAHNPLDVNIFFADPAKAKEASEPELMSPEEYVEAIRSLQQQMDHLQSLKLARERSSQQDDVNCI